MRRISLILVLLALPCEASVPNQKPMLGEMIDWSDPLSKGLVGCWLLNEGSGTRVNDLSGNGQNGVIAGVVWVAGPSGPCLDSDASVGDRITISHHPNQNAGTAMTWAFRIKLATVAAGNGGILNKWTGVTARREWAISRVTADLEILLSPDGSATVSYLFANANLLADIWYDIAYVYGNSQISLYINGKLNETKAAVASVYATTETVWVFDSIRGRGAETLDWVAIFNRALTPAEIAELYRDPFAMFRRVSVEYYVSAPAAPPAGGGRHQVIIIAKAALPACIPLGIVASMTFMMWCERRRAT